MNDEASKDGEKIESAVDTLSVDRRNGLSRLRENTELERLIQRQPEDQIGGVRDIARRLINKVAAELANDNLPFTHAIWGGWGSGKTYAVTEIAKEAQRSGYKVVYFNAFRYASFAQIVPSLVYRILRAAEPDDSFKKIIHQADELARAHLKKVYPSLILPSKLLRNTAIFARNVQSDRQLDIASKYYGKVDEFQTTLIEALKNEPKPIIVIIDELDRCDPIEAFDVMKQLRVLLFATGLPIYFIIAANPEPIGMALKGQHGLQLADGYEALNILEKFIDHSEFIDSSRSVVKYIQAAWARNGLQAHQHATILSLASQQYHLLLLPNENQASHLYSNLRILDKCCAMPSLKAGKGHLWSRWCIELLRANRPSLLTEVAKFADDLAEVADRATGHAFQLLCNNGVVSNGQIAGFKINGPDLIEHYATQFVFELHRQIGRAKSNGNSVSASTLSRWAEDRHAHLALAHLCLLDLGDLGQIINTPNNEPRASTMIANTETAIKEFRQMLAMALAT